MARIIFIFLDGVGVGQADEENPFFRNNCRYLPFFQHNTGLPDGTQIKAIDPLLGVQGIPQSATGQTTLFTGINAPALLNQHVGSYPNKKMRQLISKNNLLLKLKDRGCQVKFLNAYPKYSHLFDNGHVRIEEDGKFCFSKAFPDKFKKRLSTTTCMMISAGEFPCNEKDILKKQSLYQDFTNLLLIEQGLGLPLFSPEQAATILTEQSKKWDLLLYEYFQTDLYAHRFSDRACDQLVTNLDRFLGHILKKANKTRTTLILTSDHGNLEDMSRKNHTHNPVPLLVWGKNSDYLRRKINNISEVAPAIEKIINSAQSIK